MHLFPHRLCELHSVNNLKIAFHSEAYHTKKIQCKRLHLILRNILYTETFNI